MPDGHVFITAPSVDFKTANRFLVYLKFEQDTTFDFFHIIRTKKAYEVDIPRNESLPGDKPGDLTAETFQNAWAGSSLQDVEGFALDTLKHNEQPAGQIFTFLVLDERGVQDQTCIVAHRHVVYDKNGYSESVWAHKVRPERDFNKDRVPWSDLYSVWANLIIANMGFDEYCDGGKGVAEGGWWTYSFSDNLGTSSREAILAKLVEEGKA